MPRAACASKLILFGLTLALFPFPCSTAPAQEKRAARSDPMARPEVERGRTQFEASCGMCHGSEAKGGTGPSLIDSSLVRHDENANLIGDVVTRGRAQKGMPAFPDLSPTQISDIAAFLHASIEVADNIGAGGPRQGYSLARLLTGDANSGKAYFNGQAGCSACHSPTGDLKGVAKRYSPTELEGQMLLPSADTRTATVTLPSGETFKGKILHQDAFYISIVANDSSYHSWPLTTGVTVKVDDPLHAHRELLERYTDKDIHDLFAYLETLQ